MTKPVQTVLMIRRGVRASYGYIAILAFVLLNLLGVFRIPLEQVGPEHLLVAAGWLVVFGMRFRARLRTRQRQVKSGWSRFELCLLLLVFMHTGLQLLGGFNSPFYPLLYLLVAFLCSYLEPRFAWALVFLAICYETAIYFLNPQPVALSAFAFHAFLLLFFGLFAQLVTRLEIGRLRRESQERLEGEKKRVKEDAQIFRLVVTPSESAVYDEERLCRSSIEQVHHSLYFNLALLKRVMKLHSCVVLMHDESGEQLHLVEVVSDSDEISEGPFRAGEGAIGGAEKRGQIINLEHVHDGYNGIGYYRAPSAIRAFLAVPIKENGNLRGALCADRIEDIPFDVDDQEILLSAAEQIVRIGENERVFVQLERSKREQTILYQASKALGAALNEDAVFDAGLKAAAEIVPYEFAAVTLYDSQSHRHYVRRAVGEGAQALANLSFRDNTSLTAMAVKNCHFLPYRGEFDGSQQIVYTKKANLTGMGSLLILPLIVREKAMGTFALAARRRNAFTNSVRPALQALANQLAIALSNAALVARLERLATTDGLTGCRNKHAFHEELESKLRAAERFKRKLSLVIADLDHFKNVNDTYGHAIGDVVLRELGRILQKMKRETDSVARFGGEEFCLLCEETDSKGAYQLAERVREELTKTIFQTELGNLNVTCSLGVATYPHDARDRQSLFAAADRALYIAKQRGRNCVCSVGM
ncbi:MAG: diguanylate cyclase [Deltaproteobacteria bacterium]|nr:diguanylate cyclase [Deltaproteobacteria bacterium]